MLPVSIQADREMAAAALLLAASSVGTTRLTAAAGVVAAEALRQCLAALGAGTGYHPAADGSWTCDISGRGLGGLSEPSTPLLIEGPEAAMLAAVLATHPVDAVVTGSLPEALLAPLRRLGAAITARRPVFPADGLVSGPFWIRGAGRALPPDEPLDIVPSLVPALLLAALNVPGRTTLISPDAARWLPLFSAFGVEIMADGSDRVTVTGERELVPAAVRLGY